MLAKLCLYGLSKLSGHENPVQSSSRGVHQQDFTEQLRVKPTLMKFAGVVLPDTAQSFVI